MLFRAAGRRECSTGDTTHKQAPTATQARAPKLQRKSDQQAPNPTQTSHHQTKTPLQ